MSAEFSEPNRISFPRWEVMRWKAPARGSMPPVTFCWHHAPTPGLPPSSREKLGTLLRELGVSREREEAIFKGPGALLTNSHNTDVWLLPEDRFKDIDVKTPRAPPASKGRYQDWIRACRGGETPWANFGYAATFNEFLMLGPVATLLGREFEYDPVAGRVLDVVEADRALGCEYRSGWKL